jgi:hypothetical protein
MACSRRCECATVTMQLLLVLATLCLLLGVQYAAAAHSADPRMADIAAEVANPVPDDAEMDALFSIPEIARTIVAARTDAEPAEDATPLLGPLEIWARGRRWRKFDSKQTHAVLEHLTADEVSALRALCGRCLYHTLNHDLAAHGNAYEHVFVATGDIDAQWLRDSAVQLAIYLPRIAAHPIIRPVSARAGASRGVGRLDATRWCCSCQIRRGCVCTIQQQGVHCLRASSRSSPRFDPPTSCFVRQGQPVCFWSVPCLLPADH